MVASRARMRVSAVAAALLAVILSWGAGSDVAAHAAEPKDCVLLVPGLAMSVLRMNNATSNTTHRVWVEMRSADTNTSVGVDFKNLYGWFDPLNQYFSPYQANVTVFAPPDEQGLLAVRNLVPSARGVERHLTKYMEDLIEDLEARGYVAGKTLFAFPYDWRQSNRLHVRAFEETLRAAARATGSFRPVTLISHSMGNMVVKSFLAEHFVTFDEYVGKWISVAPPNEGAGGNLFREVLQGFNDLDLLIKNREAHGLGADMPAIYELLPRVNFNFSGINVPAVDAIVDGVNYHFTPSNFSTLFERALRGFTVTIDGQVRRKEFSWPLWLHAIGTRDRWHRAHLPHRLGFRFYVLYGTGVSTPWGLSFKKPVADWDGLRTAGFRFSYVDGDGTVPAFSALHDGYFFSDHAHRFPMHKLTHYDLIRHRKALDTILCLLEHSTHVPCTL